MHNIAQHCVTCRVTAIKQHSRQIDGRQPIDFVIIDGFVFSPLGPLLLTWINFNLNMDK